MSLPCLTCEGTGCVRERLNVAGDYLKHHCGVCKGSGRQPATWVCACHTCVKERPAQPRHFHSTEPEAGL